MNKHDLYAAYARTETLYKTGALEYDRQCANYVSNPNRGTHIAMKAASGRLCAIRAVSSQVAARISDRIRRSPNSALGSDSS